MDYLEKKIYKKTVDKGLLDWLKIISKNVKIEHVYTHDLYFYNLKSKINWLNPLSYIYVGIMLFVNGSCSLLLGNKDYLNEFVQGLGVKYYPMQVEKCKID